MKTTLSITIIIMFIFQSPGICGGQEDLETLYEPFLGKTWVGHFQNSDDSTLTHIIKFETILDGKYIKMSKSVPEVNFSMETYIYFDKTDGKYKSLTLNNRGISHTSEIFPKDGIIFREGMSTWDEQPFKFRNTFEIKADGTMHDYFYSLQGEKWVQGHFIIYLVKPESE